MRLDMLTEGMCFDDTRCYTHYGTYNHVLDDTSFYDEVNNEDYCLHGSFYGVGYYPINLQIYVDGPPETEPTAPTLAEFQALLTKSTKYRVSYPYLFRIKLESFKIGTYGVADRYFEGCEIEYTNTGIVGSIYVGGNRWRFYMTVWENQYFEMYQTISGGVICPPSTTLTDGNCIPDYPYEWCSDIGGELCRICNFCELEVSYKISDNGV